MNELPIAFASDGSRGTLDVVSRCPSKQKN
jgi:hypothetical protein